jgi:tetratricopeptide (TPR) repeat protein
MIRIHRFAAVITGIAAVGALAIPASAQYASEYVPPKLIRQGTTTQPISGVGTVVVQVQINPNGTHKVTRVLHSTNSGDNAAAMEIARTSSYRPAHRGTTPVMAFYDFTLKFNGKSVAAADTGSAAAAGGAKAQIDRMIRAGNYAGAKSAAEQALQSNPNDSVLNSELGAANYFLADYPSAAAAFDKVQTPSKEFSNVAAQSYEMAAAKLASTNPSQAVTYGQKAVAMAPSASAYFGLGAAQLNAGDTASAVTNLKKAHDLAFADPKADAKARVAIDSQLMQAYIKAGDSNAAQATAQEIKTLDPNSDAAQVLMANQFMNDGNTASKEGKHADAIAAYEKAAQVGGPKVAVTAYAAAALEQSRLDKPDYTKMKGEADKALAVNPNDPLALFAEGIALYGQYVTGGSSNAGLKQQSVDTLNKAKAAAQAAGNVSLSMNIDNFMKQNIK